GERQYAESLQALREAAAIQPGKQIQMEIERLEARIALQQPADRASQDIRLVLKDGKPDAAATLGADGLKQYGESGAGGGLEQLRGQADALVGVPLTEATAKKARFQADLDAALKDAKEPTLRGAAMALEQLVLQGGGEEYQKQLNDVQDRLRRYDD